MPDKNTSNEKSSEDKKPENENKTTVLFSDLKLSDPILKAVEEAGYEAPSAIQAETIPLLLEGRDMIGQAQTGTGKTAAFSLPLLSNLDLTTKDTQILVLAPTRELAIQVAEAMQSYARHLKVSMSCLFTAGRALIFNYVSYAVAHTLSWERQVV
jgi:superfamily II DNA/RNA helicase